MRASRRRLGLLLATTAAVALVGLGAIAIARLTRPLPPVHVIDLVPRAVVAPPRALTIPWPTGLEAALALPGLARGAVAATTEQRPVPIASLAKLMTAYLTLRLHPLRPGASGPTVTITLSDVARYWQDVAEDQSSLQVVAGEHLSEYQLLQGLIVRSANNFAQLLADFDAGSQARFVALMNRTANRLALRDAHFADASGFSPATVATASDVATLASLDMANPVFDKVADESEVTLPVVGTLPNIVGRIGTGEIVGIKSGYTIWSGGCVALAATDPDGPGEVVAVVLGLKGPQALHRVANIAARLLSAPLPAIEHALIVARGRIVGELRAPWFHGAPIPLVVSQPIRLTVLASHRVRLHLSLPRPERLVAGRAGTIGSICATSHAASICAPVSLGRAIPPPSWWWRLTSG